MIAQKVKELSAKVPYSLKVAILIMLVAKLAVFSLGYVAAYTTAQASGGSTETLTIVMNMFANPRGDSSHYMYIAQNGYVNVGDPANFIVFFPLYPFLVRLITVDFAYVNLSGLIVANISSIIAVIYLFKLAKLEYNDSVAKKAVLFLCVFPTAYFLSAVFTEGLFFALTIAGVYYARNAKWPLAGVIGVLAALTRLAGLLLVPVFIVEYFHQREWKIAKADLKLIWTGLPVLGFLEYLVINYQVTGDFFKFMEIERVHWYQTIDPLLGLQRALFWPTHSTFPENLIVGYSQVIFAAFGLAMVLAGIFAWRKYKFRLSYQVYLTLTWMLSVSTGFWLSVPRYIMSMFPMFILLAIFARNKTATVTLVAIFMVGLGFFTWLFAAGKEFVF